MGIVDFDVLDGVEEFLSVADRVGLRATAGMETRAYLPEFATRIINSPGEPGITYHMCIGFTSGEVPEPRPETNEPSEAAEPSGARSILAGYAATCCGAQPRHDPARQCFPGPCVP